MINRDQAPAREDRSSRAPTWPSSLTHCARYRNQVGAMRHGTADAMFPTGDTVEYPERLARVTYEGVQYLARVSVLTGDRYRLSTWIDVDMAAMAESRSEGSVEVDSSALERFTAPPATTATADLGPH